MGNWDLHPIHFAFVSFASSCSCVALASLLVAGCGTQSRCEEIVATLSACFPDLQQAQCTEQTVAEFERLGLENQGCRTIQTSSDSNSTDSTATDRCGPGRHVCNLFFCCNDYSLTWSPSDESDWDIIPVVEAFQAAAPGDVIQDFRDASADDLLSIKNRSYLQSVAQVIGGEPQEMAVELTAGLIDVPFATFVERLPVENWGIKLAHYLGGEVEVDDTDAAGRATRQLERMVLSPFPCDVEGVLSNNDMTKVERIVYREDSATVYWRVMYSDNNSTEADVGSVEFKRFDDFSTLVTFHSAHRLNAAGGIHIPNLIVREALGPTFADHIRHYRQLVEE